MPLINVLIADSQALFAQSLAWALQRYDDIQILEERPTRGPACVDAAQLFSPDVALIDYWLVDMDGVATTRLIAARAPGCRVLMLGWLHGPDHIRSSLQAGAVGFIPKSVKVEMVADAIRQAHSGEFPVFSQQLQRHSDTLTGRLSEALQAGEVLEQLTTREIEVLKAMASGAPREEIAQELFISVDTLKNHIRSILEKTGTRSRSEAVAMAVRCGWIQM